MTVYRCGYCGARDAAYGSHCHECGDDWANARPESEPPKTPEIVERADPAILAVEPVADDAGAFAKLTSPPDEFLVEMSGPPREGQPKCPSCAITLLVAHPPSGGSIHGCERCGGVWLDRAMTVKVLETGAAEILELVARADLAGPPDTGTVDDRVRRCPVDRSTLDRVVYRGVIIDTCSLHGNWFDANEIRRLRPETPELTQLVGGGYRTPPRREG